MTNRRVYSGIFISISLLVLVGSVAGHIPDTSAITTSSAWVIANGADQTTITVTVSNSTLGSMTGTTVVFTIDDPIYGTLTPSSTSSDAAGKATSTFKVKTKSGAAIITAIITSHDGFTVNRTVTQNIDHDTPYYDPSFSPPLFTYPLQGTVATEIPFKISMYDRWGNPVDNRTGNHPIGLHVSSPVIPDDCGFNDGGVYKHDITLPLQPNGTLLVNVKLTTKIGLNYIRMDSIGDITYKIVSINAVAGDMPFSMTGSISDGGILMANGMDKFTLDYFLYDIYGNPMANRSLWISTNLSGEQTPTLHTADSNGLIRFYYGPKTSVLTATITASAYNNASVNNSLVAQFVNSGPTNMVLAVTPQTMASREINPAIKAYVRATVIDLFGNPVPNQIVRFDITNIVGVNASIANGTPSFSQTSVVNTTTATTDADGNAIVLFYPGSFPLRTEYGWSKTANASCTVTAQWGSVTRYTLVSWKNYPYLSIDATASPQNIVLNETFDVTIKVVGDGHAMAGKPVTAILDMDCTGNMFGNPDPPYADRASSSKAAAKAFVDKMIEGQDYVGLNSFGTFKNEKFDLPPQASMSLIKLNIDDLVKGSSATDFVKSITDSIANITATQPSRPDDEVRAVIILHDAGASNINQEDQDAIVSAALSANPKIYIFTVLYYDGGSTSSSTEVMMRYLANQTGGQFFKPSTPQELEQAYIDISGILHNMAGVNATMMVNYQNVEVNSTPISGGLAFDYIPVENGMTSPDSRTTILWPNNTRTFRNQSDEWTAANNYQLHFDIGTINISEKWETTYRLKANQTGLIRLFDNRSTISFNNGADLLEFPDIFITVNPNTTPIGLQTGTLSVTDLVPQSGEFTDSVPMQWNLNYTGFDTVTETYWYSYNGLPFKEFGSTTNIPSTNGVEITRILNPPLDVTKFPPGEYQIRVIATVPGIPPAQDTGGFTKPAKAGTINIWLK